MWGEKKKEVKYGEKRVGECRFPTFTFCRTRSGSFWCSTSKFLNKLHELCLGLHLSPQLSARMVLGGPKQLHSQIIHCVGPIFPELQDPFIGPRMANIIYFRKLFVIRTWCVLWTQYRIRVPCSSHFAGMYMLKNNLHTHKPHFRELPWL